MARFRATIKGQRGEASRLGNAKTGLNVNVNGWNGGVNVEVFADGDTDQFHIYQTGGSSGAMSPRCLGIVKVTASGIVSWEPINNA